MSAARCVVYSQVGGKPLELLYREGIGCDLFQSLTLGTVCGKVGLEKCRSKFGGMVL